MMKTSLKTFITLISNIKSISLPFAGDNQKEKQMIKMNLPS